MAVLIEGHPPDNWQRLSPNTPPERKSALVFLLIGIVLFIIFAAIGAALYLNNENPVPGIVLFSVSVIVSLPFVFIAAKVYKQTGDIERRGIITEGRLRYKWGYAAGRNQSTVQYAITVQFSPQKEAPVTATQIHPGWYRELAVNDRVELLYDPDNPLSYRIIRKL